MLPDEPFVVLVIPSIRENSLHAFLDAWEGVGGWDAVVLVEDNPTKTFHAPGVDRHYAWDDVDRILGDDAWIISHRDSAIRTFGFLAAHHMEADVVVTLDDDCYVHDGHENLVERHLSAMGRRRRWTKSIPDQRMRGLPYKNLGELGNVMANAGLWSNVADYDSVQSLTRIADATDDQPYEPPSGNRVIPRGRYSPVCGMNLCFKRAAIPAFYFPRMGEGSPYRRMDDIWAGIIAKRIFDHLGWSLVIGEPFVKHIRASDPFVNLVKEATGIRANETFWELIDAVKLTATDTLGCVRELGTALVSPIADTKTVDAAWLAELGRALGVWARLLETPLKGFEPCRR